MGNGDADEIGVPDLRRPASPALGSEDFDAFAFASLSLRESGAVRGSYTGVSLFSDCGAGGAVDAAAASASFFFRAAAS